MKRHSTANRKKVYHIVREGRNLLHAADRYILDPLRLTLLKEGVINLA
jgi:hypothetical protein